MRVINKKKTAKILKDKSIEKGINAYKLADMLYLTEQSIYAWFHARNVPTLDNLLELSRIFDCSIEELISYDDLEGK